MKTFNSLTTIWASINEWVIYLWYYFLFNKTVFSPFKGQLLSLVCPFHIFLIIFFISVPQSCPTLCDPMNHSMPGLPVHQQLPEFTQTHVHWVGDANQPSHPLSSPSPPAPNPSQHQSTSWETLGWVMHKPESRLPGEISITSDMQMTPPYDTTSALMAESEEELKSLLMKVKEESKKVGLKLNI